jgi:hypothetical protein
MTNGELLLWLVDHAVDTRWYDSLEDACAAYWIRPPVSFAERVTHLLAKIKDLPGGDIARWEPPPEPVVRSRPDDDPLAVLRRLAEGE